MAQVGSSGSPLGEYVTMHAGPVLRMVDAVTMFVPDLNEGLAFYGDRLGHELIWRDDKRGQAGLRLPEGDTELVLSVDLQSAPNWLVTSVPDAVAAVVAAGGTVVAGPEEIPVGSLAVAADPFGNSLILLDLSKGRYVTDAEGRVTAVAERRALQDGVVAWRRELVGEISARLPAAGALEVVGSSVDGSPVDGWSDLDLHLRLPHPVELVGLLDGSTVWAAEGADGAEGQVVRIVLLDGRRVDFVVETGRLLLPRLAPDNDVRFLAALAVSKLGRGDRLIGLHLLLELLRSCLVQAMLLRDRDEGTNIHRVGTARDRLAEEITELARQPFDAAVRPNVVERAVEIYGRWRSQLESGYEPDWSGLSAVIARGLTDR